jgi:hypothetical protein
VFLPHCLPFYHNIKVNYILIGDLIATDLISLLAEEWMDLLYCNYLITGSPTVQAVCGFSATAYTPYYEMITTEDFAY